MEQWNEYKLEKKVAEDIKKDIRKLAESYTPEWNFNTKEPDAGSVIALIYANQHMENINKYNLLLHRYHTEFVNMLGISLLPAHPAKAAVVMELADRTVDGTDVSKGTKLLGANEQEEAEQLVFETLHNIHITNSRLTDILMISGRHGKIIPLLGRLKPADPLRAQELEQQSEIPGDISEDISFPPEIALFDFTQKGIGQNSLLIYHKNIFDLENDNIYLKFTGRNVKINLAQQLSDRESYRFCYYSSQGFQDFDRLEVKDDILILQKSKENKKVRLRGEEYSLLCLEARKPVMESLELTDIRLSSSGADAVPTFIHDGITDQDITKFLPFGEEISLYSECYIGNNRIFSKQEAYITVSFRLSHGEKKIGIPTVQEEENLKIIKRKPKAVLQDTLATTMAETVSVEYYNGRGWRKLECLKDCQNMFDIRNHGEININFICPPDWEEIMIASHEERCIRLQVLRADNCYMQPCLHYYPVMEDLKLSYTYQNDWKQPQLMNRIHATTMDSIIHKLWAGESFSAFYPMEYMDDSLFLGFDKPFLGGPVSLLFEISSNTNFTGTKLRYEYSSPKGFQPLKLIDHTNHMMHTGMLLFMPPTDFSKIKVEGQLRYWIRIGDTQQNPLQQGRYRALITSILLNAVEVHNVETLEEEEFYIDTAAPNMSFALNATNILSTQVYVNEKNRLTINSMKQMIKDNPEQIRVEYNFLGEIEDFFVRWTEVENFDLSKDTDRHYCIDRMNNTIHFGDGVCVMIPTCTSGVAFTVTIMRCNGIKGNLSKNTITEAASHIIYVNNITNPVAAFGGSNMEDIDSAFMRGANMISSRNRLISEIDFIREILSYSSLIDKVKCICGQLSDGSILPGRINFVILMKDYADRAFSFHKLKEELQQHLLRRCEISYAAEDILITEPLFVRISVELWMKAVQIDDSFEIQHLIKQHLEEFLNPVSDGRSNGWEIGSMPGNSQIKMMLHSIKCNAEIYNLIITAAYTDKNGEHETDLDIIRKSPFAVCMSGAHQIHVMFPD